MIHRAPHDRDHPFARVSNEALRDERLSFRARGLLAHLLTRPDDWTVVVAELVEHGPDGKDAVRAALSELEVCSYLVRERQRRAGRFQAGNTQVYEVPELNPHRGGKSATEEDATVAGNPPRTVAGNPPRTVAGKPPPENPPLRTTDSRTTDGTNYLTTDGGDGSRSLTRDEPGFATAANRNAEIADLAAGLSLGSSS